MERNDVVIVLKDGSEIKVMYPLDVYVEYETPWLDTPGYCETCDCRESLAAFRSKKEYQDGGRFVIGEWLPWYNENNKGERRIFLDKVRTIIPLSKEDQAVVDKRRAIDNKRERIASYRRGTVTRDELASVLYAIARLNTDSRYRDLAQDLLTPPEYREEKNV